MKHITAFFAALFVLCNLSAQHGTITIETIDTSKFVVEYVPIATAQKNVAAQLTQVTKQLETVDKQIADLMKKRDELLRQKTGLEFAQKQLDKAAAMPVPKKASSPTTPPPPPPKKSKSRKKKN